jgi:hypothetical protein
MDSRTGRAGPMVEGEGSKGGHVTTIRASCPTCGDVELTVKDVTVRVCAADNRGAYSFRCPACRCMVVKDAEQRIVDLLVSSGVELHVWQLPAELFEAKLGEPLTWDDLLDLHDLLQTDGWFAQIQALVNR